MYDQGVCFPSNVNGWTPLNTFKTFIVKSSVSENFAEVNNGVKKVCDDISDVVSKLSTMNTKMGDNTGTTSQVKAICDGFNNKREDLVKKNQELFAAIDQVVEYISQNKTSKFEEASTIKSLVANISVYGG